MKREITPQSKKILIFYRITVAVIIALVLILALGSLFALTRPPDAGPLFSIGANRQNGIRNAGAGVSRAGETTAIFTGIGRLRIPVEGYAGAPAATVILSVSFPYPTDDRPFAEELASRIGEFRSIAIGYFSSLSANQIARFDEETAKTEILNRYNALLRLGKIETLFFTDLIVIE